MWVVFMLVAVAVVAWLVVRSSSGGGGGGGRRRRVDYGRRLVSLCHGDETQAQRLVRGQMERDPTLDDDEATRRAVLALERDRGR
jgi:hypothetical protein